MAEIGHVAFNAWEMVHGSAMVVIDCDFRKVVAYVLQDSVMGVLHISSVLIVLGPELEFKNEFGSFSWIHNCGVVCMCCVDTDVIARKLRFTVRCGGHGGGDSLRLHSGQYYGYGGARMYVQTKNPVLSITLVCELYSSTTEFAAVHHHECMSAHV